MYKIPKVIGKLLKFVDLKQLLETQKILFTSLHEQTQTHTHTHTNTLIINKYTYHLVIYILKFHNNSQL